MNKVILVVAAVSTLAATTPSFAATAGASSTPAASSQSQQSTRASAPTHLSLTARAQTKLKTLNIYSGPVNGRRDPATVAAIRSFQTQNHLTVNGRVDAPTKRALGV